MADGDDPLAEVIATGALVLLLSAVIAGVIGVVEWGRGSALTALVIWAAALIGFAVSVAYFVADGRRHAESVAELPFPSLLDTQRESAR